MQYFIGTCLIFFNINFYFIDFIIKKPDYDSKLNPIQKEQM